MPAGDYGIERWLEKRRNNISNRYYSLELVNRRAEKYAQK
jgi:hypothetical protein